MIRSMTAYATAERATDGGTLACELRAVNHRFLELGLRQFCVPPRAFTLGRENGTYHRLCPADIEPDFLAAYDLGRDVHAIEQELASLEDEIESLLDEIDADKTSETAREMAEQRLRYVKKDRDRRERDRDALLERARRLGYGNVW